MCQLTSEEIERYKRHIALREVGVEGQRRLKAAKVLVVGTGGLGSSLILYLAAAGIGTIGIVDDDIVSLNNLQRQVIHNTANIGMAKVFSAKATVARINPHVTVNAYPIRIDSTNALDLIQKYDIVADGSDNFATRYLISDACFLSKKPLVFAAIGSFDGYLTTFKPYLTQNDGTPYPTYRCLFPELPSGSAILNSEGAGIFGAIPGVLGTLQASEIMKEIIGAGNSLVGYLLIYEALSSCFHSIKMKWNPDNPLSGTIPKIMDLSIHNI
ncbi:MAG: Sulfur carrier protein adenylyltransferase [Hyphomicrobiaceae bacterium hypho_1]